MSLRSAPSPAEETIDATLAAAFLRAGADWRIARATLAPDLHLCPMVRPPPSVRRSAKPSPGATAQPPPSAAMETTGDRWLPQEFPASVLALADDLKLSAGGYEEVKRALKAANPGTMTLPTKVRLLTNREIANHTIDRQEASPVLQAYLEPLLSPTGYAAWLADMARRQFLFRGGESTAAVPLSVIRREQQRDRELLDRWSGSPPAMPPLAPTASSRDQSRAELAHQKNLRAYEERRRRGGAVLATDPNALPFGDAPASDKEGRELETINRLGRRERLPLISLGGGAAPANLYISEVAPTLGDYFVVMRALLAVGDPGLGLSAGFAGFAYGVLTLASVPVSCLYDTFHGTCTTEIVAPRLLACVDALAPASRRILGELVDQRLRVTLRDQDDKDAARFLAAFLRWVDALTVGMRGALLRFLRVAADQGGGRISTPVAFTGDGQWSFELNVRAEDGTDETLTLTAPESLSYEARGSRGAPTSARDTDAEIFWMLPALWEPVGSAVALANQAGARVWVNAANNRWGGHHPPHRVHRQGVSLDVDVGLSWRGDKVQNVVKRDNIGVQVPDADSPGNSGNAECLHFMERIAAWILTQSFILVGVTQYLYGDAGLVEQAALHLKEFFEVDRPARMDGVIDAAGHNDHWHFEVLVAERPTRVGPYVFQVTNPNLLEKLRELAEARDKDPVFWEKFAGLEAAPTKAEDFDGLEDAEDWKKWWALRDGPGGVPLLPVWAPSLAKRTFAAHQCWAPRGDFPDAFHPGDVAV